MRNSKDFHDAMICAFHEAADNVELWEFGGADTLEEYNLHRHAAEEVAKRIRKMADRYFYKHLRGLTHE
jgi:hypothetical protein